MVRKVAVLVGAVALVLAGFAVGLRWGDADSGISLSANDIGFAQDMAVHHEQAVLLSQALAPDVDPQIRLIADQIIRAQTAEVATMHGWLTLVDEPFTSTAPMTWMHADHSGPMAGMASVDEITRLRGLRGTEAEILFLQLMIRHHHGGIEMAQAAQDLVDSDPIRRTALGMVRDQGTELGLMLALLTTRGAEPLAYP